MWGPLSWSTLHILCKLMNQSAKQRHQETCFSLIRKWLTSIDNALICYSWCVSLLPNGCTLRYKCKFSAGQKLRHRFFGHKSFVKWQVAQLVERRFFLQKPSTGVKHAICSKTSLEFGSAVLNLPVWTNRFGDGDGWIGSMNSCRSHCLSRVCPYWLRWPVTREVEVTKLSDLKVHFLKIVM